MVFVEHRLSGARVYAGVEMKPTDGVQRTPRMLKYGRS